VGYVREKQQKTTIIGVEAGEKKGRKRGYEVVFDDV
jgi:hypothetical protein